MGSYQDYFQGLLDEEFIRIKPYLNDKYCCKSLHDMCKDCEQFVGLDLHNYDNCRGKRCFEHYLGYAYLELTKSYDYFGD